MMMLRKLLVRSSSGQEALVNRANGEISSAYWKTSMNVTLAPIPSHVIALGQQCGECSTRRPDTSADQRTQVIMYLLGKLSSLGLSSRNCAAAARTSTPCNGCMRRKSPFLLWPSNSLRFIATAPRSARTALCPPGMPLFLRRTRTSCSRLSSQQCEDYPRHRWRSDTPSCVLR